MNLSIKENVNKAVYRDAAEIADSNTAWDALNNSTVLITGAGGFISYYLVLALLDRNDRYGANIQVAGVVRSRERAEQKYGDILKRGDIKLVVQDICEELPQDVKADYIIHAASQASAWHFENDPVGTINANLTGTVQVLEFARKVNSKAVLFISSLKTYGSVHDGSSCLMEETTGYLDHTSYKNCYAVGKRAAETLCASYSHQYGMDIKIVRPSYIYGPTRLDDDRVWAQFIANMVKGENILLKSNGAAYRSFCYVTDTASAIFKVLLEGETMQPYNIASEISNTTIRGFAQKAIEACPDRHLSLAFQNKEDEVMPDISKFDATPEILNSEKLEKLGWTAKVDIIEGIRRSIASIEGRE